MKPQAPEMCGRVLPQRQAAGLAVDTDHVAIAHVELVQQMCDQFDTVQRRRDVTASPLGRNNQTFALAYGLDCHAHDLARNGLEVLRTGSIAAVPIARAIFEAGVTAQWLRLTPGAEYTLLKEHRRLDDILFDDLATSELDTHRQAAADRPAVDPMPDAAWFPDAPPSAKFQRICTRFAEGHEIYIYYRMLCGHTHAGVKVADDWLAIDDDQRLTVRRRPRTSWSEVTPYFALLGLIWSARAFDDMVMGSPRSNFLNRMARGAELTYPRLHVRP